MFIVKIIGAILGFLLLLVLLYRLFFYHYIPHLPIKRMGFTSMPAYPIKIIRTIKALLKLNFRGKEVLQAKFGLNKKETIKGFKANAFAFCYTKNYQEQKSDAITDLGKRLLLSPFFLFQSAGFLEGLLKNSEFQGAASEKEIKDSKRRLASEDKGSTTFREHPVDLTSLSLDKPEQFKLSWTQFGNVAGRGQAMEDTWVKTLKDPIIATQEFFPTMAKFGIAYNLLVLEKVTDEKYDQFQEKLKAKEVWSEALEAKLLSLKAASKLYAIDFTVFEDLIPQLTHQNSEKPKTDSPFHKADVWRYTPATFTWLEQDDQKQMSPFAVHIFGNEHPSLEDLVSKKKNPSNSVKNKGQVYIREATENTTWIYALQAVKVSTTVFGIWLGHVYPWHIVTAAMAMTFFNTVKKNESVYQLVEPHVNHVIGFNDALLLLWKKAAPPTSITTGYQFLEITNKYAENRSFFDDDPKNILEKAGIKEEDFTVEKSWDAYKMIGYQLKIWENVKEYVTGYVKLSYPTDEAVKKDAVLQKWISTAAKKGNVRGLPSMNNRADVINVLTSFLYRFTVHGLSRLNNTANPAMTFVANFPPTLQRTDIPDPSTPISPQQLMEYMPRTGTIGRMIDFYFTFADSAPYESLVPVEGLDQHLLFSNIGMDKSKDKTNLNRRGKDKDSGKAAELNKVLLTFRERMVEFMDYYNETSQLDGVEIHPAQVHQWPLSVET